VLIEGISEDSISSFKAKIIFSFDFNKNNIT